MVRRVLTWGGVAFLVFFVAYRPATAKDLLYSVGGGLMDIAHDLGDFFSSLTF